MNQDNKLLTFAREGRLKADYIIECLQLWGNPLRKPTVLVLDNAPIHQGKCFREKLAQWQENNLFIFFLPPYCPHLNKIETRWRKVKYEWLQPKDYVSLPILKQALDSVFSQVGQRYSIHFCNPIL